MDTHINVVEIYESEIKCTPMQPMTMYICKDSHNIFYDSGEAKRIALRDNVVIFKRDADRAHCLFPKSNKIYIVLENKSVWMYIGTWIRLSENPKTENTIKKILRRLFDLERKFNDGVIILTKRKGPIQLSPGQTYSMTMNADVFFKLPEMHDKCSAPEIKVFIARNGGKISFGTPFKVESLLTAKGETEVGGFTYLNYTDLIVTFKWIPTNKIWAYDIQGIRR